MVDNRFADGLFSAAAKIVAQDGVRAGLYASFAFVLSKQIPYAMAKFTVQSKAAEYVERTVSTDFTPTGKDPNRTTVVSLVSGAFAGVAAAVVSHPADTLLNMMHRSSLTAAGSRPALVRLMRLAKEAGVKQVCLTGFGSRCAFASAITAGQFGIFDMTMRAVGADKFRFRDPSEGSPCV